MTLKFSSTSLFFSVLFLLPLSVKAQQKDVTVTFPGGDNITGQLRDGANGLYLDSNNGQYYKLGPGQNQINQENQALRHIEAEQENLKEAREREHFEHEQRKMSEEKTCRDLLFDCQLPNHTKQACQNFIAECNTVKPLWRMYVKSEPVALPLEKTALSGDTGFILPSGQVLNFYHHPLGYVAPKDMNSALVMARTARAQDNDTLPASFPKSSPQHPYHASADAPLNILKKSRHVDRCVGQLHDCMADLSVRSHGFDRMISDSCLAFKKECPDFPSYLSVFQRFSGNNSCQQYLLYCRKGGLPETSSVEDCHDNLKLCNRDPASAPPSYDLETDCPMDDLICKAFDNKYATDYACQRFKKHQCASHNFNFSQKKKASFQPFWTKESDNPLMKPAQQDWPSCAVDGNVLVVASDELFSLGSLSDNGHLNLYQEGKIFHNVATVSPEGKLLKKSKKEQASSVLENPDIEKLLSHFSYIGRISPNGTVWHCGKRNRGNQRGEENMLFLDGVVAFRKRSFIVDPLANTHYYRASRNLNEADMRMMQRENIVTK